MGLALLHRGLQQLIREQNWRDLTAIQHAALRPVLTGESCVLEAPTAGGKTEAVMLPALTRAQRVSPERSVLILYIAPLRALLNNLESRISGYAGACGFTAFKWHGDVSQAAKSRRLADPPEVLLTTPESLEAILLRKASWRELFRDLQTVIIDEAHNFAGGDRGSHLLSLLERLEGALPRSLQRLALTATIGNPDEMCSWVMGGRPPARRITVPAQTGLAVDYLIQHFSEEEPGEPSADSRQLARLKAELAGKKSLVFVRSRHVAEQTADLLKQASRDDIKVRTHHGNVGKYYREQAESLIHYSNEAGINAIISTSTLELGIDIGELDRVIQLGSLSSPGSFLQRVGRTGRRPGTRQYFRGFTTATKELLLLTAAVSLGIERRSEALQFATRAFHILAHQLLCLTLQQHGITAETAWRVLHANHAFSRISGEEYRQVVAYMMQQDYLRRADGLLIAGEQAEKHYLTANWRNLFATFNSAPLYDVYVGRTQVGTLDTSFVTSLEVPFVFTLGGNRWQANVVTHQNKTIRAVPAAGGIAPKWDGFGGPAVPFETAQRVGEFLHRLRPLPEVLDQTAAETIEALSLTAANGTWRPGTVSIVQLGAGHLQLVTYAGDSINIALRRLLEADDWIVSNGDFASMNLVAPDLHSDASAALTSFLTGLSAATDEALFKRLTLLQKPFVFSPFAHMLPDQLRSKAIVDRSVNLSQLRMALSEIRVTEGW